MPLPPLPTEGRPKDTPAGRRLLGTFPRRPSLYTACTAERYSTSGWSICPAQRLPRRLLAWIDAARRTARELAAHLAEPGSSHDRSGLSVAGSGWG